MEIFKEYGVEYNVQNSVNKYKGFKLSRIITEVEKDNDIEVNKDFVEKYRSLVETYYEDRLEPMPEVSRTLESIGLPVCIASSAPKKKILHGLEVTGLSNYFNDQTVFSSYEINSWKPEPQIFTHAADSMGFYSANCMAVDDAEIGIKSALAADMKACYYNVDGKTFDKENVFSISHSFDKENVFSISHMPDLLKIIS